MLLLIGGSTVARAADWYLGSHYSTTGVYDDNLSLQPVSRGDAWGLLNGISIDLQARNPTSALGFVSDFSYDEYFGAGAKGDRFGGFQSDSVLSYKKQSKLTDLALNASHGRRNANATEVTETGIVSTDVTRLSYNVDAQLAHRVNRRNSLSWNAAGSMIDFTGPSSGLVPYHSVSTSGSWHYKATKRTDMRAVLGAEWFVADNPTESESISSNASMGLLSRLSKSLTFDAEAGISLVNSRSTDISTPVRARKSDLTVGFVGNASLTYVLKRTSLVLSASRSVSPGSLGDLQTRTSIDFAATHTLNDLERISLLAGYSELAQGASSSSAKATAREILRLSLSYSYRITEKLRAELAYRLVHADGSAGSATSNSVLLTLSRDFTFLP